MITRFHKTVHIQIDNVLMIFDEEVFKAAIERGKAFKRARALWDRKQRAQAAADEKRAKRTGLEPQP